MRRAAEDSGLRWRRVAGNLEEAAGRDAALLEAPPERAALVVRADRADRDRRAAERAHVGGGVAGAARETLLAREAEDEDRRLAADAPGMAVDEAVEDEVARDREPAPGKRGHEPEEPVARDVKSHGMSGL